MRLYLALALCLCCAIDFADAASLRICVSTLPLMGHINPLKGIIAELISRKISVTVAAFSTVATTNGFKPVTEVFPQGTQFIPLGAVDSDFDPYAETETVAKLHRTMYTRLSNVGRGFDVWLVDAHALGAIAAAEDLKHPLVLFSSTLPSEFMHAAHVFKLDNIVKEWPVIINTAKNFDIQKGERKMMYGDFPPNWEFVGYTGSLEASMKANPIEESLQTFLTAAEAKKEPVIYISLGTVKKIDMRDVDALMVALSSKTVVWSLPKENQAKLNVTVPSRFYIREWLPQAALLSHSAVKLFISHCGMNSAHETMLAGKPSICIPQSGEQIAVAQRFLTLKLGHFFSPTHFNNTELATQVRNAVNDIHSRYDDVAAKMAELGVEVRESGGAKRAADVIIEAVKNRTKIFGVPEMQPAAAINTAAF